MTGKSIGSRVQESKELSPINLSISVRLALLQLELDLRRTEYRPADRNSITEVILGLGAVCDYFE
jgi:hypothetical protein